ncbi:hypothetical protein ABIC28_000686 [Rhodococcus sp. PvR044]|jgi:hypothetical protein|nr:hypothetical protein [Rhodococcus sp. PvR099]
MVGETGTMTQLTLAKIGALFRGYRRDTRIEGML